MESEQRRILVVEDDPSTASGVVRGLRRAGFEVELATDGASAIATAEAKRFDLVVLDLMLPVVDGEVVLRRLHARSRTPAIVVTARIELSTRLDVFALGAVDYLPKPFFVDELVARAQARLGRKASEARVLRVAGLRVDVDARAVDLDDTPLHLTPTELAVLVYLVERPGYAVGRSELTAALRDHDDVNARTLDAHVARLRKKLGSAASMLTTVWGHGYRFEPAPRKAEVP